MRAYGAAAEVFWGVVCDAGEREPPGPVLATFRKRSARNGRTRGATSNQAGRRFLRLTEQVQRQRVRHDLAPALAPSGEIARRKCTTQNARKASPATAGPLGRGGSTRCATCGGDVNAHW